MDNIFEIALESAYGNWNEPLLEASLGQKVMNAVKAFFEKVSKLFRTIIARVKNLFNGKKSSEDKSSDNKDASDGLEKELEDLEKEVQQSKHKADKLFKENRKDLRDATNHSENYDRIDDECYKLHNKCEKLKNKIAKIDYRAVNDKEGLEKRIKESEPLISHSAKTILNYATEMTKIMEKAFVTASNCNPDNISETLEELESIVEKLPDLDEKRRGHGEILDMQGYEFKRESFHIVRNMFDNNKLDKVRRDIIKKINDVNNTHAEDNMNLYMSIVGNLNKIIAKAVEIERIIESISRLYNITHPSYKYVSEEDAKKKKAKMEKQIEEIEKQIEELQKQAEKEFKAQNTSFKSANEKFDKYRDASEEYGKAKRRRDSKIEEIRRKKEERATKESLDVYELNL